MDGRVALYPRAGCMGLSYMSAVTTCKAHDDEFRTPGLLNALNVISKARGRCTSWNANG